MSQTKAELVNGLSINAAATDALTIDSNGDITFSKSLGIGAATSTGYQLQITGQSGYDDILRITAVGTNMGPRINLTPTGTGTSRINATANNLELQTGGETAIKAVANGAVELYHNDILKCSTYGDGLNFPDLGILALGADNDLKLYHYNGHNYIHSDVGDLNICVDTGSKIVIQSGTSGNHLAEFNFEGAAELFHNGNQVFYTESYGAVVKRPSGGSTVFEVIGPEGNAGEINLKADDGDDNADTWKLKADHVASGFYIQDYSTGSYVDNIRCFGGGAVELYHSGHKALNTTTDGIQVYGSDNSNCIIQLNSDLSTNYSDKYRFKLDDGGPLYIQNYNSGSWVTTFTILNTGKTQVHADASTAYAFEVYNDGSSFNRYGVKVQCGQDSPSSDWNWPMAFNDGDGTNMGNIKFNNTGLVYDPFTAAHHCIVPDADNPSDNSMAYPYGTLLEITEVVTVVNRGIQYKVQKTQTANSRKVLGAYGGSMNGGPNGDTNLHDAFVLGDGHILVNNAGGNIEVGDGICSSATAGIGQKATANPSMIIGIAQEAITFTGSETKLVAVQYGLQQFTPWS